MLSKNSIVCMVQVQNGTESIIICEYESILRHGFGQKVYLHVSVYGFVYADCLQHVLCMWVLWANQLSYICVVCPLCLIIYSLRYHTAGWLCSLQLVFLFSPHLACLNKTVSILKALSFNHAVTPHKIMAVAGRYSHPLNKIKPKSQQQNLCNFSALSCEIFRQ